MCISTLWFSTLQLKGYRDTVISLLNQTCGPLNTGSCISTGKWKVDSIVLYVLVFGKLVRMTKETWIVSEKKKAFLKITGNSYCSILRIFVKRAWFSLCVELLLGGEKE